MLSLQNQQLTVAPIQGCVMVLSGGIGELNFANAPRASLNRHDAGTDSPRLSRKTA